MKKVTKRIGITLIGVICAAFLGFNIYASDYYRADETAQTVLTDGLEDGSISQKEDTISLSAGEDSENDVGLIFYPGGKVEYIAYLPLLEKLQEQGINCYLVKMPFNLAFFGAGKASKVIEEHPEIEHWYIGGHSLGGAFASQFASKHEEQIDGLILLGAYVYGDYPKENSITIYGSEDQVLHREKVDYTTNVNVLDGGNHGAFGNYGLQSGDGTATISSDEQQDETVELIMDFIRK